MSESRDVTLVPAEPSDEPVLSNLLELYLHDLSDYFPIDLGVDGRFGYYPLAPFLSGLEPRWVFLIRVDSRLAGFALATRSSPLTDDPNDLDVTEFFVSRRYRRAHVGLHAACLLWDRLPGDWIVRVAGNNQRALAFWRTAVSTYTRRALPERTMTLQERAWHVLDFDAGSTAAEAPTAASP
jgi:predicted acetyltransferase